MKDATGEVSMTVVTIVIIAAVLAVGTWLFSGGTVQKWITDMFESQMGIK